VRFMAREAARVSRGRMGGAAGGCAVDWDPETGGVLDVARVSDGQG